MKKGDKTVSANGRHKPHGPEDKKGNQSLAQGCCLGTKKGKNVENTKRVIRSQRTGVTVKV